MTKNYHPYHSAIFSRIRSEFCSDDSNQWSRQERTEEGSCLCIFYQSFVCFNSGFIQVIDGSSIAENVSSMLGIFQFFPIHSKNQTNLILTNHQHLDWVVTGYYLLCGRNRTGRN